MGIAKRWMRPLSEEDFAQALLRRLTQAGDDRSCHYDSSQFQLRFEQEGKPIGYANLRNLYEEYRSQLGKDESAFFQQAVRSLLATHKGLPDEFDDLACDLLLSLRSRAYFSLLELQTQLETGQSMAWPYLTIGEHLGVALAYDLPEAMVLLQDCHLQQWGTPFYRAYEVAMQNLSELNATFVALGEHTFGSASNDCYDASRLLLTDVIAELPLQGDAIAMVPHRDHLLVTGADDRDGLDLMGTVAQHCLRSPRPISGMAFLRVDNDWQPWLPPTDHPSYRTFKSLRLKTLEQEYREQTVLLKRGHAQDAAIATPGDFRLHSDGQLAPVSYTVWREGEPMLLPCTDRVCLARSEQTLRHPLVEGANWAWDELLEVAGDLLIEDARYYPARYRTVGFPTAAYLAKRRPR